MASSKVIKAIKELFETTGRDYTDEMVEQAAKQLEKANPRVGEDLFKASHGNKADGLILKDMEPRATLLPEELPKIQKSPSQSKVFDPNAATKTAEKTKTIKKVNAAKKMSPDKVKAFIKKYPEIRKTMLDYNDGKISLDTARKAVQQIVDKRKAAAAATGLKSGIVAAKGAQAAPGLLASGLKQAGRALDTYDKYMNKPIREGTKNLIDKVIPKDKEFSNPFDSSGKTSISGEDIQNVAGEVAGFVLDPINFIPGGLPAKAGMAANKASKAAQGVRRFGKLLK